MTRDNKNIIYTAEDIEKYLSGRLSPGQMHAMEKAALDDPFLADAMEGYEGMKGREWNNELMVLREQIAEKGAVAKVIPLHKSKNNWWKAVAAVLILGAGATLTYVLTENKTKEKINPQVAQNVSKPNDSIETLQQVVTPASMPTNSANTVASVPKAGNNQSGGLIAQAESRNNAADDLAKQTGSTQVKTVNSNSATPATEPEKTFLTASAANNNVAQADEIVAADKYKASDKANNRFETEAVIRQKNQVTSMAKKDQEVNNYFTAQVVGADNSPLPFTNISIKKENFGTYADIKGMVRLVSPDSTLIVEVKSVGYLPKIFMLHSAQPQTKIVLQEDLGAQQEKTVAINKGANTDRKLRQARLVADSAVNVEPTDGWDNYNTYVANNLNIPDEILDKDIHGEVELTFDVKANGTISNIRVNKSLGAGYDEAAKRLIQEGPQWKNKKGKKTSASVKLQF